MSRPGTNTPPLFQKAVFDTIGIKGSIQVVDDKGELRDWTAQEAEEFMSRFFAFLDANAAGFGGAFWPEKDEHEREDELDRSDRATALAEWGDIEGSDAR